MGINSFAVEIATLDRDADGAKAATTSCNELGAVVGGEIGDEVVQRNRISRISKNRATAELDSGLAHSVADFSKGELARLPLASDLDVEVRKYILHAFSRRVFGFREPIHVGSLIGVDAHANLEPGACVIAEYLLDIDADFELFAGGSSDVGDRSVRVVFGLFMLVLEVPCAFANPADVDFNTVVDHDDDVYGQGSESERSVVPSVATG